MTEARLTHLVAQLLGNREVIPFSPAIARAIGDVEATVFLCQACYWQSLIGPGKWFFKLRDAQRGDDGRLLPPVDATRQSWEWETALSRTRQESARRRLKALGLLEEALKGVPAQLYYRVNLDRLTEFLFATHQLAGFPPTGWQGPDHLDGGVRAGQSAGEAPTNTKTTSKSTQTTTTSGRSSADGRCAGVKRGPVGVQPATGSTTPLACPSEEVVVVVDKWAEPYKKVLLDALSESQLDGAAAQEIADEFAGVLEAASLGRHRGIVNNARWLGHMVGLHKSGDFRPNFCYGVRARRERAKATDTAATPLPTASDVARAKLAHVRSLIK